MRIAIVIDNASVTRILEHIGEPTKAPLLSPARGPPVWDTFDQTPVFDPLAAAPDPAIVTLPTDSFAYCSQLALSLPSQAILR